MTVRRAAAAILLALTCAHPAGYADEVEYTGFSCGFWSLPDFTGVVDPDLDVQYGRMDGGPWTAFDLVDEDDPAATEHVAAATLTMHCWLQLNVLDADFAGRGNLGAHCEASGTGIVAVSCPIQFRMMAVDWVFTCTAVEMEHEGVREMYLYDWDDDPANGAQCAGLPQPGP